MWIIAETAPIPETNLIAIVLAVIVAPCLLAWLNARTARGTAREAAEARLIEKAQDYAREDLVAAQAAEAAALLARNQAEVAAIAEVQLSTLRVVHTLVNNDMTESMRALLAETEFSLEMMRRDSAPEAIAVKTARVKELRAAIEGRQAQAALVDRQSADAADAEKHKADL